MKKILYSLSFVMVTTALFAQVTLNPTEVFINREHSITSSEVLGVRKPVNLLNLWGGMYIETNGNPNGRPYYGYAIDNTVKSYTYFDGANSGLHTYVGGIRESIWKDSIQWSTSDGSLLKFFGYKLGLGKNGNTILGYQSVLQDSPSNIGNTVLGSLAAQALTGGVSNTIVGNWSSWKMTTGDYNTTLGAQTGADLTSGSRNTMIGYYAGSNTSASSSGNVFLGYRAGEDETGSDKLYIANSETTDPLIYGDFSLSQFKVNGTTTLDGATVITGNTLINQNLTSQDIHIKDSNPFIQFYQNTTPQFYLQYQSSNDQFVLVEIGEGQVLKFKDGEVYLPQMAGNGSLPLRVENDGRLTTDLPSPITYTGLEFHPNGTGVSSTQYILVKDLQDGMTLTSMECVVHCFGDPVGSITLARFPKTPSASGTQVIFSLNPPGNGCGTWSTGTVVTAGSNVIDTDTYHYYFNTDETDAQEYSEIRLHH